MAVVFNLRHESNDFSEYDATPGNGFSTKAAAALGGTNFGVELDFDVSPTSPDAKHTYGSAFSISSDDASFGFRYDFNNVAMVSNGDAIVLLRIADFLGFVFLQINITKTASGFDMDCSTDQDAASTKTVSATNIPTSGDAYVEILWTRPSSDVAADGTFTLRINGSQEDQVTDVDNFDNWEKLDDASMGILIDHNEVNGTGTVSGQFYIDEITFRDDSTLVFATNTFRFLGFDADTGTLMVSGLKDEATLKLFDYDLDTLTENGTASFGSATDTELDNRTRGIFPVSKPLEDDVWYLYGRDGNNIQVQYNDRNGTLGWQDLGPGTATWGTAKYAVGLLTTPMVSDDVIVAFADADVYRTRYGTETWVKMGTAPTGLRSAARHPTRFNELLLAGTVGGTMHYSPNFGASFTDASHDIAAGSVSHSREWRVTASGDDGYTTGGGGFFDTGNVSFGHNTVLGDVEAWVRWPEVGVPNAATVTNAYIEFTARTGSGTVNVVIYGEDADNPSAPSSRADYTSRPRTGGSVLWSPSSFSPGATVQTPDISTIVQEIINRGGWSLNNAMQLFIENTTTVDESRQAESYDSDADNASILHVEYTDDAGLINAVEVSL